MTRSRRMTWAVGAQPRRTGVGRDDQGNAPWIYPQSNRQTGLPLCLSLEGNCNGWVWLLLASELPRKVHLEMKEDPVLCQKKKEGMEYLSSKTPEPPLRNAVP